jgi:hypothetical protein
MPNPLDVSQHYKLWHNTELVSVHQPGWANGEANEEKHNVDYALRRSLTQLDIAVAELSVGYVGCVWNIAAAELPDKCEFKRDYWIEASDGNWTVKSVDLQTFKSRWRCVCVRQVA